MPSSPLLNDFQNENRWLKKLNESGTIPIEEH